MPPKKNATAKGPFFFFMLEFRKKEEAAGYRFTGGMPEVTERAGPLWEKLAPYEREPYNIMAKKYRAHPKDLLGERYTSQGIAFSQVETEAQKQREHQQKIQQLIMTMIHSAVKSNKLEELEVFMISCNYFCATSTNDYIPAELAMVKYSLADGIKDRIHILINPQELPLGLAHDAELHTAETHQLPLPPDAVGETDFEEILKAIFKFTGTSFTKKQLPRLFTYNKDLAMVTNILVGILEATGVDNLEPQICPLVDYFYYLKQATESYGLDICTFPSVHMAKALLEKDVYAYTIGIGCEVHEGLGNSIHCSLSKCVRWAFTISDSCCLDLGLDMEPGKHLPRNMTLPTEITETVSCVSSRFNKTILPSNKTRDGASRRPRSSERQSIDQANTTIYSSRVAADEINCHDFPTLQESLNTTNPFYKFIEGQKPGKSNANNTNALSKPNPWSRELKLNEVRVPLETHIPVIGRGRGTLVNLVAGRGTKINQINFGKLKN
ncbi:protein maelstrom homolog [Sabethes cyaneus]|uniref:protein maelstrom homolog n=1 Tax=Sabethes cyaneus TaxID=53552 RepID=UPI00237D87CE|nr:protein maelstrom homolog [Sabethes cyaneus]